MGDIGPNTSYPTPTTRLQADRRLPLLDQAVLVLSGPGAVVVDQLDLVEGRSARGWWHVLAHGQAVGELDVQLAGFLGQHPVDEGLGAVGVRAALDDAHRANLVG